MGRIALVSLTSLGLSAGIATAKKRPVNDDLEVIVETEVGEPVMLAEEEGKAYIEIVLTGFTPPKQDRTPLNLALVIDRSGSMRGDRLEKAKEAALMVVDTLSEEDILTIVTYDTDVEVLVPPTRVQNRREIRRRISAITDRGSTALYAGVSQGIEEVQQNFSKQRVNRIVLLSDGKANVGPSTPDALAELGVRAGGLGIPITTVGLGLGYNEDLMTQLALSSDGNHGFAEEAADLARIFQNELGDAMSVVANDVIIEIEFERGITPIRGLNRPLSIKGNKAKLKLNQIYGDQKKNLLVEVKVPKGVAGKTKKLANVGVQYRNLYTKKKKSVRSPVAVKFSKSKKIVESRANKKVMVSVVEALGNERQKNAIALRDKGKVKAAQRELEQASTYLRTNGKKYGSKKLEDFAEESAGDAAAMDDDRNWNKNRKKMKKSSHGKAASQSW